MNRYTKSFLFSFGLYFFIFVALVVSSKSIILNDKIANNSVQIALYTPQIITQEPKLQQKRIIKDEQKFIKSEIKTEQKIEKQIEKIIQPQIEKLIEKPIEKIVEKPIEQITKKVDVETKVQQKSDIDNHPVVTKQPLPIIQTVAIQKQVSESISQKIVINESHLQETLTKKKQYFALIKNTIEKHKYYPHNALKRGIECDIKVKFIISPMGQLLSLELIEGNKIFHNSAKEAIEKSFPLLPPKNILSENETLSLTISYTIN
ncbi:MAG: energy transducer TonB [Epsilonproteobacteria bacterium]|nr:energy transducer TonB [Campylobacterota bacterium]